MTGGDVNDGSNPGGGTSPRLASAGALVRCLWLLAAVAVAYPIVGYVAADRFGDMGWWAAAVAAGICWLGAAIALILTALLRGPQGALYAMLVGMMFRMGLPLVAGVVLTRQGGDLASGGVFGCLLAFYLVTLVVETALVLPLVRAGDAKVKAL